MSLIQGKNAFVNGMITLQKKMLTKETDAFQEYAQEFADLVIDLIKSAEVKEGIAVSTTGSASAQTGKTTQKGQIE